MTRYALIDDDEAILRRQDFDGLAPVLAAAKGLRWVTDAPPAYDPATHYAPQPVLPVTGDAVSYAAAVPIPADPQVNTRAAQLREADLLEAAGDELGALKLRVSLMDGWPPTA